MAEAEVRSAFAKQAAICTASGAPFTGRVCGLIGARLAKALSGQKGLLNTVFAGLIFVVAFYMLYRSAGALGLIG